MNNASPIVCTPMPAPEILGTQQSGFSADSDWADVFASCQRRAGQRRRSTGWIVCWPQRKRRRCVLSPSADRVQTAGTIVEGIEMLPFDQLPDSYIKETLGQRSFEPLLFTTTSRTSPDCGVGFAQFKSSPFLSKTATGLNRV